MNRETIISKAHEMYNNYTFPTLNKEYKEKSMITACCPIHGPFRRRLDRLLNGLGCSECSQRGRKKADYYTTESFIKKAQKLHGDKYDYSKVEYKKSKEKVVIICKKHGEFLQSPNAHLHGYGCKECGRLLCASSRALSREEFIEKASLAHNRKYDYSLVDYENGKSKIKIICPTHGVFVQLAESHLLGHGCPDCSFEQASERNTYSTDDFISVAKERFGERYDYSNVKYVDTYTPVEIVCKKHGLFRALPFRFLQSSGCPKCVSSKGENKVMLFLEKHNIEYIKEKSFDGCFYKNKLRFDFYLPQKNICIEYNGKQHYGLTGWVFSTEERLKEIQIHDEIKRKFCKENGIKLIEIKYTQNIDNTLSVLLHD